MPLHSLLIRPPYSTVSALSMGLMLLAAANLAVTTARCQPPAPGAFAPASDLLSDTTAGMVRIVDLPQLINAWQQTSLARLADDPAMQPFWESQQQRTEQHLEEVGLKLGLRWNDLKQMVSGEVVVAWMTYPDPRHPYAVSLLADIRQRAAQAEAAIGRLDQDLQAKGATRVDTPYAGQTVQVYTMPRRPGQLTIDQIALAVTDQRLILGDREAVVNELLDAIAGRPPQNALGDAKDFQAIDSRLPEDHPAGVRWFGRPLSLAMIIRELAGADRGQRIDIVRLLGDQGLDAIIAAGGQLRVAADGFDLLHNGFVWAPPVTDLPSRYKLAARMLQFPNAPPAPIPAWVGPEAATCLRLNWNMEEAFWAAETLVDQAFGDKIFRPTLEGIREDEEGPQIDIAGDIVANLGDHLILVTDNTLPASLSSERSLIAIKLRNPAPVQQAVRKAMESEPDASLLKESPEHPIWEVLPQDAASDFDSEIFEDLGFEPEEIPEVQRQPPLLERWAISVVGDYLMFSSHPALLLETVRRAQGDPPAESFASQADVQTVLRLLLQIGGPQRAMGRVVLPERAGRVKYELMRQGKLRESDSVLAALLRRVFEDPSPADRQANNAAQLPPFAKIAGYLHPAGSFLKTEPEGWSMAGFLLGQEKANPDADAP